jgi:hypothetical protein
MSRLPEYARLISCKLLSKWLPCLYTLLAVDMTFTVLYVLYGRRDPNFSLDEGSYSEISQHLKEAFIAVLLVVLALRARSFLYFGWSLVFLYIWLDDALQIHETLGDAVSEELGLPSVFGVPPQQLGELVGWAFFGLVFLIVVAPMHHFSRDLVSKQRSRVLLMLLAVFALPTVVLDTVHSSLRRTLDAPQLNFLLGIGEDVGEMVVMSTIVWYVLLTVELTVKQQGAFSRASRSNILR